MEELDNIFTLADAEENEIDYELLDVVPFEGGEYAVLLPLDDDSDEKSVTILRLLSGADDDAEETLEGIADERVLNEVFRLFLERNQEE
ncbi:MAG: DUF1292 domain-containing protein [Clostridiaceae bacterium]|nr:DUF1292 domain-containing protein [Eubacteriales bacterium]